MEGGGIRTDIDIDNDITNDHWWKLWLERKVDVGGEQNVEKVELTRSNRSAIAWNSTTASLPKVAWARSNAAVWIASGANILKLISAVAVGAVGSSIAVSSARNGTVLVGHDWGAGNIDPAEEASWRVGAAEEVPVTDSAWGDWSSVCWEAGGASGGWSNGAVAAGCWTHGWRGGVHAHRAGGDWTWAGCWGVDEVDCLAASWNGCASVAIKGSTAESELGDVLADEEVGRRLTLAPQAALATGLCSCFRNVEPSDWGRGGIVWI